MMLLTRRLLKCGVRNMSSWQIFGSALLTREALTVKTFTPLEKAYYDLLSQIECENSLLSDFELQERKEKEFREHDDISRSAQVKILLTGDILRNWEREAAAVREKLKFTPETDVKSLKRCLEEPLTLLVKQKLGEQNVWLFPQSLNQGEETLRQTVERAISDSVGDNLKVFALGNAPCSFYQYKYPKEVQAATGSYGAKVFHFKVRYVEGTVELNEKLGSDHMWANYEELMEKLPSKVAAAVRPAIFIPPRVDYTQFLNPLSEQEEFKRYQSAKTQ